MKLERCRYRLCCCTGDSYLKFSDDSLIRDEQATAQRPNLGCHQSRNRSRQEHSHNDVFTDFLVLLCPFRGSVELQQRLND